MRATDREILSVIISFCIASSSHAWTASTSTSTPFNAFALTARHRIHRTKTTTPLYATNDKKDDDEAVLTDLDARILQTMLQDEKLDLQEEDNMRKLLERGIKSKEPLRKDVEDSDAESPYSSQVLQTLGNTKLWQAFQRNAQDILESAKIFVSNKVERDAKLLASLGVFAFDRALQDIKRALPAASAAAQKVAPKVFQLAATSSFKNKTATDDNDNTATKDVRLDMTTPADEIKSISQDLKEIFQSGGELGGAARSSSSRRGLSSVAPSKTGTDRFKKAFNRQQETTLRRERENIAQKGTRVASNVIDSAYQVKRELEVEPNQPGYKTRALREGAVSASKLLASGATAFLGGAKEVAQNVLLKPSDKDQQGGPVQLPMDSSAAPKTASIDTNVVVEAVTLEPRTVSPPFYTSDIPVNTRVPWAWSRDAPATPVGPTEQTAPIRTRSELQSLLATEIANLSQRIERCIQRPDETWLNPNLIQEGDEIGGLDLEPVVKLMILTQQALETADETFSFGSLLDTLQQARRQIQQIVDAAGTAGSSKSVAEYLERQLIYGQDFKAEEEGLPILLKLNLLEREWGILEGEEQIETEDALWTPSKDLPETMGGMFTEQPVVESVVTDSVTFEKEEDGVIAVEDTSLFDDDVIIATRMTDVMVEEVRPGETKPVPQAVVPDIVEVEVTPRTVEGNRDVDGYQSEFVLGDEPNSLRRVTAEIVTDDDFEDAVGQTKNTETMSEVELEAVEDSEPNPVAQLGLRSLDVVLLVVEKTIMAIPTSLSIVGVASNRIAEQNEGGLGSKGWETIKNVQRGDTRY